MMVVVVVVVRRSGNFFKYFMRVAATLRTIPATFGRRRQINALEMKPLNDATATLAEYHVAVRDVATRAIQFFLFFDMVVHGR